MMCTFSEQGTPLNFQMSVKCSSEHEAACSHVTRAAQAQMQVSTCMMQSQEMPSPGKCNNDNILPSEGLLQHCKVLQFETYQAGD